MKSLIAGLVIVFLGSLASAVPLTLTWNGPATGRFSEESWSGAAAGHRSPQNGDTLVFPVGGTFENDVQGLSVAGLVFSANDTVTLAGKSLTLENGGTGLETTRGVVVFSLPLVFGTALEPALPVTVAKDAVNTFNACCSGPGSIEYLGAGTVNLCAESTYTGQTTIRLGQIHVYANQAFGSSSGATSILLASNQADCAVTFEGVTTDENFDNTCQGKKGAIAFPAGTTNIFNGTFRDRSYDQYAFGENCLIRFNGKVTLSNPSSTIPVSTVLEFNGDGTSFGWDWFGGGTHVYGAKCVYASDRIARLDNSGVGQVRRFRCADAFLSNPASPAYLLFRSTKAVVDLGGFDQTFWYLDCAQNKAGSCITSAAPCTVRLTLETKSGTAAVESHASFAGPVSLSFEGPLPQRLGAVSTATGALRLKNASSVTLLDGFAWQGTTLALSEGSALTVNQVSLPRDLNVSIQDAEGQPSCLTLNSSLMVADLTVNGIVMDSGKSYGSSASAADVKDDVHFSGTGTVTIFRTITWAGGTTGTFSAGPWRDAHGRLVTPQARDTLVFDTEGTFENDLQGVAFRGLDVTAQTRVTLTGRRLSLLNGGGGVVSRGSGELVLDLPLDLGPAAEPAVRIDAAPGSVQTYLGCVSGAANVHYCNGGTVHLRADGDYTGVTTITRGEIHVYANAAFGSPAGKTSVLLTDAWNKPSPAVVHFHGVTTDESFENDTNYAQKPFYFAGATTNVFNGRFTDADCSYYAYGQGAKVVYNNYVKFLNPGDHLTGVELEFNGAGSEIGAWGDWYGGGHLIFNEKYVAGDRIIRLGAYQPQRRSYRCENAALFDPQRPARLYFMQDWCTVDVCGYDQTFWSVSCASAFANCCITSATPATIHLTLGPDAQGVLSPMTSYATFGGPVTLSFEGPCPFSMGTASPATGGLVLTNGAAVTLLDGFSWEGESVVVSGGAQLTTQSVVLPKTMTLDIVDGATPSRIALQGNDVFVSAASINGQPLSVGVSYGSSQSRADVKDDVHFSGTALLQVASAESVPLTLTWKGGGSNRFSQGVWEGGVGAHQTPRRGDTLVFAVDGELVNDIDGLVLSGLTFEADGTLVVKGAPLALMNAGTGIRTTGAGEVIFDVPLSLGETALPALALDVAAGCTNTFLKGISGAANLRYTGPGCVNLRADSDYTGVTTIERGDVHVYAAAAFGAAAAQTEMKFSEEKDWGNSAPARLHFHGGTTDESFALRTQNTVHPVHFPAGTTNVFNGSFVDGSAENYVYGDEAKIVFNGRTHFENPGSFIPLSTVLEFNGPGSSFGWHYYQGGTHVYNEKIILNYNRFFRVGFGWHAQRHLFGCEDVFFAEASKPARLQVVAPDMHLDLNGHDQTFWYLDCAAKYATTEIASAAPATIRLTLGADADKGVLVATNCATFTGAVSLSCEGSGMAMAFGTASSSSGRFALSAEAKVTLLDGFGWQGSAYSVMDGAELTVNKVALAKTAALTLADRFSAAGVCEKVSRLVLNEPLIVEFFTLNGRQMRGGCTYGSTASSADVKDDVHFAGTGVLRVRKPYSLLMIVR